MTEENLSVENEGRFGEGLSKGVSEHISRGVIEKTNVATGNVMLNVVNANIDVAHSSAMSCSLRENTASSVVFEDRNGMTLGNAKTSCKASQPDCDLRSLAGRDEFSFSGACGHTCLATAFPHDRPSVTFPICCRPLLPLPPLLPLLPLRPRTDRAVA